MNKKFWTIVMLLVAYVVPVIVGFVVTTDLLALWGIAGLVLNVFIFLMAYTDRKTDEQMFMNAALVMVFGLVFAVLIFISGSIWMVCWWVFWFSCRLFFVQYSSADTRFGGYFDIKSPAGRRDCGKGMSVSTECSRFAQHDSQAWIRGRDDRGRQPQ